ncbi:ATP-dependent helicase [Pistricoccus aurantiacus]|uniref:ATP-dependent helicase n=1 Tax=Pistricoccus aurantiacus TaxID=1883414 RepID=UPI00362AFECA
MKPTAHLTAQQRAVVVHGSGHARVAAVAGAGKTTTLVARVLHLLAEGVPPRRMLVLMFNRAAKDDFTAKLTRLAPPGMALPDVRTFHSLGHRLTQSLTRWGALTPRQLLSADWQRERLLRQAIQQVLSADSARLEAALEPERLEACGQFCELVKAEMLPPRTLLANTDFGADTEYFVEAFKTLETLLNDQGLMTYADLLYRPLRVLEANAEWRSRVQGFLDHVIVDEYQDSNTAQQRLLKVLAGSQAAVMAVGDANQCIYEWRGAHPQAMLEGFTALFGEAQDYPLSMTFRHGHALALAANQAIAANRGRPDQLCLARPGNPSTELRLGEGGVSLLETLADWRKQGRALGDGCVLVRSWGLSVALQLILMREGIPYRLSREDRFVFRLPLVQALAGYLMLVRDPSLLRDPDHLLLLLSQPTPFVARERLALLAQRLASLQQCPENGDSLLESLAPRQRRNLKKRWALLCELPRLVHWPAAKLLSHVVERLDAEKVLKRAAARREKGEEDVRLLDVLIEQAKEQTGDLSSFIDLLRRPMENHREGLLITTVHGAKGLEWPLVMLWGVNEEDFPHYSRDNPLNRMRLEEERRLFYVAITRARERLVVIHDNGEHRPSRFLNEVAWEDCQRVADLLRLPSRPVAAQDAESETVLETREPELVERYLTAIQASPGLKIKPLDRVEHSRAGYFVSSPTTFDIGQRIRHAVFGEGEIQGIEGDPDNPVLEVRFQRAGRRRLVAKYAPMEAM